MSAIFYIAVISASFAVGVAYALRLWLVHQVRPDRDIDRFYGPYDMPTAVLWEVRNHEDRHFEFGTSGKDWQLDLKCKGRIRLFLWVHAYYMVEFAFQRLAQERRFPFVWWHAGCMSLLSCVAALKILVWPAPEDAVALVGFDSITAEKLARIKAAALEQQAEDARSD